jgi:hypothetical protein
MLKNIHVKLLLIIQNKQLEKLRARKATTTTF